MKPDGVAKNGTNFWNLYRVPAKVMIHQQQENFKYYPDGINKYAKEGEKDVIIMGGIKCFEKDRKLTIMYVISNARTKKYQYKWMATVCFKKKGVTLLINRKNWHEAGKAFVNATYKTMEWDHIVSKAIQSQPTKEFARKLPNMSQRRLSFQRRLSELILWKAKKLGMSVGKLNKTCARKTDFTLFRLAIGSELMSNTIYYFLKRHTKVQHVHFDASAINHKHFRFFLKLLRRQKSMEKVVKKIFGRNAKYIMRAVQAKIIHPYIERKTVYKEAIQSETGNFVMHEGRPLAVMGVEQAFEILTDKAVFDLSIFIFGHYIKDFINLDKIQSVFQDISEMMSSNPSAIITELRNTRGRVGSSSTGTLDLMPDWIQLLRNKPQIDKFFKYIGESRTERVIKEIWNQISMDGDNYTAGSRPFVQRIQYLRDSASQWCEKSEKIVIPSNIKGLTEIHDFVSLEYRKLSGEDYNLNFKEEVLAIDGVELEGGLRLKLPKTNFELVHWGQKMSNCIGGYGRQVNNSKGQQWLLGVYKNGDLKYNIEVQGTSVRQFHAHHNQSADPQDRATVMAFLAEKGLAKKSESNDAAAQLMRALEAGMYNAAPGELREGQALAIEALDDLEFVGMDRHIREEEQRHAMDAMRYAIAQQLAIPQGELPPPPGYRAEMPNIEVNGEVMNVEAVVRREQGIDNIPVEIQIGDDEAI